MSILPGNDYVPPPDTFYLAYRGSVAHGMYVLSSDPKSIDDVDLLGFCFAPIECYFGLREWGSRGTMEIKEGQYDAVFYEIRKAVALLLQGNPNIMASLWVERKHLLRCNEPALSLIKHRHLFRGKHVYNAFAGYAHAQMEKMETRDPAELREYIAVTEELKRRGAHPNHKGVVFAIPEPVTGIERDVVAWSLEKLLTRLRAYQKKGENIGYMGEKRKRLVLEHGYDAKNAAHLIRLLRMCIEFLQTGDMLVYRPDAAELLDIKMGRWALKDVKEHAAELFEKARVARDKSTLPDGPDREEAEALLVRLLKERFQK